MPPVLIYYSTHFHQRGKICR